MEGTAVSIEIEGKKKNVIYLFFKAKNPPVLEQNVLSGEREALNLLRPHQNFAPSAFRAAVR